MRGKKAIQIIILLLSAAVMLASMFLLSGTAGIIFIAPGLVICSVLFITRKIDEQKLGGST